MKKRKIIKTVAISILIALIAASVAFYLVDIIVNNTSPTENLFRVLLTIIICINSLLCIFAKTKRHNLSYYEARYQEVLQGAFSNSPTHKNKLLRSIRLYNENNFKGAIRILLRLKLVCKTKEDLYAVGLFTALTFTDMGYKNDAIFVYNALIEMNAATSTVYGNIGLLYSEMGNYDDAIASLRLAVQNDEKNPAAYNNLANMYFDTYDLENAKKYALEALKINHKFRQSASLLAIIYSIENDEENTKKYFHIAKASGEDPVMLQKAINHYKTEAFEKNEKNAEDNENQ